MRLLLLPFSGFFWLITLVRNALYACGVFPSKSYSLPVISVGNLSTGGTGKSPMIIYLIHLLKDSHKVVTLSRGYGRKTKGFKVAGYQSTVSDVGDEPLQFFHRFKTKILVTVGENRTKAIDAILENFECNLILLDDAFQHRRVKPGFSMLLTTYDKPFYKDYLLPAGNLRESMVGKNRADLIVVTKCPKSISEEEKQVIREKINPKVHQRVFFSHIEYGQELIGRRHYLTWNELKNYAILLVTGIADSSDFVSHMKANFNIHHHLAFKDHHNYSNLDVDNIQKQFQSIANNEKLIVTTEKDFMRLKDWNSINENLFYIPIETVIDQEEDFKNYILEYVNNRQHPRGRKIPEREIESQNS